MLISLDMVKLLIRWVQCGRSLGVDVVDIPPGRIAIRTNNRVQDEVFRICRRFFQPK